MLFLLFQIRDLVLQPADFTTIEAVDLGKEQEALRLFFLDDFAKAGGPFAIDLLLLVDILVQCQAVRLFVDIALKYLRRLLTELLGGIVVLLVADTRAAKQPGR